MELSQQRATHTTNVPGNQCIRANDDDTDARRLAHARIDASTGRKNFAPIGGTEVWAYAIGPA